MCNNLRRDLTVPSFIKEANKAIQEAATTKEDTSCTTNDVCEGGRDDD